MIDYQRLKDAQPQRYATAGRAWEDWAGKLDLEQPWFRSLLRPLGGFC